jgi:hypothetical protein
MFKTIAVATVVAFFLTVSNVYADKAKPGPKSKPGQCGVEKYYDMKTKKCMNAADKK